MDANTPPTIAVPASATLDPGGTSAVLSVLGADDAGESNLTYTWAVAPLPPAAPAVTFSAPRAKLTTTARNGASTMVATFYAGVPHTFTVTIADQGD